ncbi:MAG: SAM hydrolase/SAM-dependent halogenase family protein [Flavobacteriaceae bacterium]|jgi:S-adenosylmethionine hydrolase
MNIVTLTTDFGLRDFSVGVTKAALMQLIEGVQIVDISHQISPFNLAEAAYILKHSYAAFPKGSIHIVGIESERTPENQHLAIAFDDHFFVGANNGIFSLLMEEQQADKIVEINIHDNLMSTFPVLDTFVQIAAHLAKKGSLDVIGKPLKKIKELKNIKPVVDHDKKQILGSVIYIDNYGNIITNITQKLFESVGKTRPFTIFARTVKFKQLFTSYGAAIDWSLPKEKRQEDGKKMALFNSVGHLELALYKSNPETVGGANTLFGLTYRDVITVQFE